MKLDLLTLCSRSLCIKRQRKLANETGCVAKQTSNGKSCPQTASGWLKRSTFDAQPGNCKPNLTPTAAKHFKG